MEESKIENIQQWELVNWCEFDPYASKSYCAIHNETEDKNLGDITKVNEKEIADFNMMVGGSPCQDFSIAGKQEGVKWVCQDCEHEYNPLEAHYTKRDKCPKCNSTNIEKTRSSLLVEWLRVLREKKPNFAMYENVKNIVGKQFKPTFELFTEELNDYGYNTYWKVLNAKNYGIPQNRERVYLIIIKKDLDNGKFKYPEPFDNGVRLKDLLDTEVDEKFYISQDKAKRLITNLNNKNAVLYDSCQIKREGEARENNEYNPTLTSREDRGISNRQSEGTAVYENKVNQIGNIVDTGNWGNPQRGRIYSADGCSPALNCCGGGGLEPKILQIPRGFNTGNIHDECTTILSHSWECNNFVKEQVMILDDTKSETFGGGKLFGTCPTLRASRYGHKVINQDNIFRIRKLTPKECFRLMGFDNDDVDNAEKVVSNSQLYKQAGNSIVVDVLFYILVELYKAMPYLFDEIKLSSFFSGIGAFEKALDRLFECINNNTIGNFTQPQVD